ncbi:MAG: methyltransferase [Alistipes sp.]|nr:methyltransferase [Alistipes sp.]
MKLSDFYGSLQERLWRARHRLPLLLIPASAIALWCSTPFTIHHGLLYLIFCSLLSLCGLALRGAAVRARLQHRKQAEEELASFPSEGIYARMRYPLYTADFLLWFGLILYVGVDPFIVGATACYIVCYALILYHEEQLLLQKYGEAYAEQCERVPALWPLRARHRTASVARNLGGVLRNELRYWAGAGAGFLSLTLIKQRMITLSWRASLYTLIALGTLLLLLWIGRAWARHRRKS